MTGWALDQAYAQRLQGTVAALKPEGFGAALGVVLGSGLGNVVDRFDIVAERPFDAIPGFSPPTVAEHKGRLVQAKLPEGGAPVLILQGRLHPYEGLPMAEIVFPVATMLGLGVDTLMLTNAAGGLRPDARAGDFMAITELLDLHGWDPLRGLLLPPVQADGELALRAGTHLELFDPALTEELVQAGAAVGVAVQRGSYVSLWGPSYETPREIGMLRRLGLAAVGMSTGPEAAYAARLGARVVGLSTITNVAREAASPVVTHDEVVEVGAARLDALSQVFLSFLGRVSQT